MTLWAGEGFVNCGGMPMGSEIVGEQNGCDKAFLPPSLHCGGVIRAPTGSAGWGAGA